MTKTNILINTDSYKVSMWMQYPPETKTVYSYIESRGHKELDALVFTGIQAFIKDYLSDPITKEMVDEAEEFWTEQGQVFNREPWDIIVDEYLGFLPLEIKSLKEGTIVPLSNALVTVENLDPRFYWLTTWIETALLRAIWYPTTVATNSFEIRKLIAGYLVKTGDIAGLPWKLHDFGARGVSSLESAEIGGAAHLINFMGTDTAVAAYAIRRWYGDRGVSGSIPGTEHSTVTSWGKLREADAFKNMLDKFSEHELVAVVSDSYDVYNAARQIWGNELYENVVNFKGMLVARPDSGDPVQVVCELLEIFEEKFGYEVNEKGYKVLNNIRVIQGDGIDKDIIARILEAATTLGYSADNIAFGMGGALLQGVGRDDFKFAMKASAAFIGDKWVDVFKDPVTDKGKRSKKGLLAVVERHGIGSPILQTIREDNLGETEADMLKAVYRYGSYSESTFEEVRKPTQKYIDKYAENLHMAQVWMKNSKTM